WRGCGGERQMADSARDGGRGSVDDADGSCEVGACNYQSVEGRQKRTLLKTDCERDAYRSKGAVRPGSGSSGNWSKPGVFSCRFELRIPCAGGDVSGNWE